MRGTAAALLVILHHLSSHYLSFLLYLLFFRAGKLNNHLEAAIQEAMSELDKMSGTVSNSYSYTTMY